MIDRPTRRMKVFFCLNHARLLWSVPAPGGSE
jgi:hypothetical protein